MRKQYGLQGPIYAKRNALIARIPYFWRLVFEQAPPEIDTYVQPSDSEVLNACLTNITVERFEIAPAPAAGAALQANGAGNGSGDGIAEKARGDPRSLLIRFEFAANEYFFDDVLEKRFWYRRGKDGWTGLVSEPVRVAWKEGKDLMEGLGDLACDAWEEERNLRAEGKGDEAVRSAPVWKELLERVEASTPGSLSFFAWWGYRGRLVSAEESEQAVKAEREKRKGITVGEECTRAGNAGGDKEYGEEDDEDIEEEENEDVYAHEIFPLGDELAISIAEDLYPGAIKYFGSSHPFSSCLPTLFVPLFHSVGCLTETSRYQKSKRKSKKCPKSILKMTPMTTTTTTRTSQAPFPT